MSVVAGPTNIIGKSNRQVDSKSIPDLFWCSVLGTVKAATDLLEKRGTIYSSRARDIVA